MLNITKKELYNNIRILRDELLENGIKYPLDIFEICRKYDNLEIASVPFITQGLRGMVQLADETSQYNCILVNSKLSLVEQNFHGMHELMHVRFSKICDCVTFECFDKIRPNQDFYVEWVANEGAAELMLPHDILLPYIKEKLSTFDDDLIGVYSMINEIADKFRVSPVVVQNRIDSLKYEIFQYLSGCDIENLEIISKTQQSRMGIVVDSLNDIENKRLNELWFSDETPVERKPFFSYSETYRGLLAI